MAQGMLVAGWHGDVGSGNDQVRSAPGRRDVDVAKPPLLVATPPTVRAGGSRAPRRLRLRGRATVLAHRADKRENRRHSDAVQDYLLGRADRLHWGAGGH